MPRHNPLDDTVHQRLARYSELVPYKDSMKDANGIPQEAMLMMSPEKVMPIMSPAGWKAAAKWRPLKARLA